MVVFFMFLCAYTCIYYIQPSRLQTIVIVCAYLCKFTCTMVAAADSGSLMGVKLVQTPKNQPEPTPQDGIFDDSPIETVCFWDIMNQHPHLCTLSSQPGFRLSNGPVSNDQFNTDGRLPRGWTAQAGLAPSVFVGPPVGFGTKRGKTSRFFLRPQ